MKLEVVIGLEVHIQLATQSKLFCPCPVGFGGQPNSRICPVCTGQPGTLPVLNEEALRLAMRAGLALHSHIRQRTKFDRKHYFYPDQPKGYQISQFDQPICEGGYVELEFDEGRTRKAQLTRVHLEEDAGKALHPEGLEQSFVDLNRAGVALIEIVGEPDLRSPEEAGAYLISLRRTIRYAGVSACDMEKGSMRCDANISLRPAGQTTLGTKVEIKNMNSVRNVARALHTEIERQTRYLHEGRDIVQETRSFRDEEGTTISMRTKEEADDYRYCPEPDLPLFVIADETLEEVRRALPESYRDRYRRYVEELGLSDYDARVLLEDPDLSAWFEACVRGGLEAKQAANWVQGEILAFRREHPGEVADLKIQPEDLVELGRMVEAGDVSRQAAKKVLLHLLTHGGKARATTEKLDLLQMRDSGALEKIVADVLAEETAIVADYQSGKKAALNALLGRVMRASKGKGNPARIREILQQRLDGPESG